MTKDIHSYNHCALCLSFIRYPLSMRSRMHVCHYGVLDVISVDVSNKRICGLDYGWFIMCSFSFLLIYHIFCLSVVTSIYHRNFLNLCLCSYFSFFLWFCTFPQSALPRYFQSHCICIWFWAWRFMKKVHVVAGEQPLQDYLLQLHIL